MIYKNIGLVYADYIVNCVKHRLDDTVSGWVEGFNNCREQGYKMYFYGKNCDVNGMAIYVYGGRHSDKPTITYDFGNVCNDKLYSEDAYYYRTEEFDTSDGAVDRICELIMNFVNENEREDLENEKDL